MSTRRSLAGSAPIRDGDRARSLAWPALTLLFGGAAIILAAYAPAALVLPAMSILMVASGLAVAAVAYLAGLRMDQRPALVWEVAGVLVFVGFAAGMLTDDEQALAAFSHLEAQLLAAMQ